MQGEIIIACQFCGTRNKIQVARQSHGPKCSSCQKPYHLDRPIHVNEEDFDTTVLQAGVPVLVDFHADWCGPCRAMAPALDQVAQERAGQGIVAKVNTDAAPEISQRYGVRSIPYFAAFSEGELAGTLVGMQTPDALRQLMSKRQAQDAHHGAE